MATEEKAGPMVSGEELEIMLTEWDEPLIVDAYATWCGPCLMMAPEFEAAAKELKGRVRFVKLDTDEEPEMSARLNIMGLPTLMFLDKFEPEEGSDETARAVLKDRIEGAIRKESIIALAEHHFFGGPKPETLG
jgi:thioredoxin